LLENFNQKLIEHNDSLLLAVSGGIDSMVMLHYIQMISESLNLKLSVAHLDHLKRKESSLDKNLVKTICDSLDIDFYSEDLEPNNQENFHDYAHVQRFEFFLKIANKIGANKVVLAHNANDNAETILMRLVRGSSFEGYRGILEENNYKNIRIIRPLIHVSRKEITEYQKKYNVSYNEDKSNTTDHYTRNRYRHHILPLLDKENPKYLDKINQFSEYQTMAYDLIERLTNQFLDNNLIEQQDDLMLPVNIFNMLDEIIKIESLKKIINLKTNNNLELSYQNLKDIKALFENKKPHVELQISNMLYIYKSYNLIHFLNSKPDSQDFKYVIDEPKSVILPDGSLVIITKYPNKYYGNTYKLCYNNLDLIFPLTIRNRVNGDKIITDSGTKKLKDIFINKKIPMETRNTIPIVLNNKNEIVWIPKIHEIKTDGENILYLIYQEGKNHAWKRH